MVFLHVFSSKQRSIGFLQTELALQRSKLCLLSCLRNSSVKRRKCCWLRGNWQEKHGKTWRTHHFSESKLAKHCNFAKVFRCLFVFFASQVYEARKRKGSKGRFSLPVRPTASIEPRHPYLGLPTRVICLFFWGLKNINASVDLMLWIPKRNQENEQLLPMRQWFSLAPFLSFQARLTIISCIT